MNSIIFNGDLLEEGAAIVSAGAGGLRYGDGCFETMRATNGRIVLKDLHFARLLSTLELLHFDVEDDFSATIQQAVDTLLIKNRHDSHAKVRLMAFRGVGDDDTVNYIIETSAIDAHSFNKEGLVIDVYRDARKQCDHFSHLKCNNYLAYVMAARWAKQHELDDAIILNANNRIADSSIANLFIVQNGVIRTPVLSEGCISGVMRKYLINSCRKEGIPVEETTISAADLQSASEVFLTNAIKGIRWVKEIGDNTYSCQVSKLLSDKIIRPLWK